MPERAKYWETWTDREGYCCSSPVQLFATPWTASCQALLSMGFPKQEYWSGLPFPPPGILLYPGIKLASSALAVGFLYHIATWVGEGYNSP